MPQVQVTPQYVNAAKPGKQYGNIKEASGAKWIIPAGWEGMFAPNVTAHVDYETKTWGAETVNIVRGVNGSLQPPAATPTVPVPQATPPMQPALNVPTQMTTPTPQQTAGNGRYTDQQRAQDIFVTGTVGRILSAKAATTEIGQVDFDRFTKWAVAAWEARHVPEGMSAPTGGYDERNPPPADPNDAIGI